MNPKNLQMAFELLENCIGRLRNEQYRLKDTRTVFDLRLLLHEIAVTREFFDEALRYLNLEIPQED